MDQTEFIITPQCMQPMSQEHYTVCNICQQWFCSRQNHNVLLILQVELLYISSYEFLRTPLKYEKHTPTACALLKLFCHVLKTSCVLIWLNNALTIRAKKSFQNYTFETLDSCTNLTASFSYCQGWDDMQF